MAYGELKVDSITFTDGGSDATVSVSGLVKNPTFSGDIVVSGNISGTTITGDSAGFGSVTGVTVTGTTANFVSGVFTTQVSGTAITGNTAGFTTVTGTTVTGTTANFVTVSGTTVTGDAAQFTSITGGTAGFTTVTGTTVTGTTANFVTVSGTAITGDTAGFTTVTGTTVTGTTANFNTVSGTTVTGGTGNFTSVSATTATVTSGVFAAGTAAAPSVSVGTTDNGLYSPGTDQVAISTSGTSRLYIASDGKVGVGTTIPSALLQVSNNSTFNGLIRVGGNDSGGIGLDIDYSNSGATTTVIKQLYRTSNANALINIDTGIFTVSTGNSGDERLRITSAGTLMHLGTGDSTTPAVQFNGSAPADSLVMLSDGKVGLGTSSPVQKLDVADGDISLRKTTGGDTSGVTSQFLRIGTQSGDLACFYAISAGAGGPGGRGGDLYIQTKANNGSPTDRLVITEGGLVGIGTTSPIRPLSVSNGGAEGFEFGPGDSSGINLTLHYNRSTSAYIGSVNQADYHTWSAGGASEKMRLDSSGRLLVGTSSSPSSGNGQYAKLAVQGSTFSATGAAIFNLQSGKAATSLGSTEDIGFIQFTDNAGNDFAWIRGFVDGTPGADDYPGALVFSTTPDGDSSPDEVMRITSDKYVRLASGTGGIQFGGDTAAANALDDYEEATWTPGGISTTGGGTLFGKYIRVGSQVTAWVSLVTFSGTLTLPTVVTGLPYARAASRYYIGGSWGLYTETGTSYQAGAVMTATNLSGFAPVGAPASSVIDGSGAYLSMMVTYTVLS